VRKFMNVVEMASYLYISGLELQKAFEAIAEYISDVTKKISEDKQEYFVVEHTGTHLMLKKLIQHDKERFKNGEGMV
jgi:chaperonin GroEL (HSP60 family)